MFVITPFYFTIYVYILYTSVLLFSRNFYLYPINVFVFARVFALLVGYYNFVFICITNLALWLQDFNKLTYLLACLLL